MYKIRATYLPRDEMTFDRDYYFRVHVPLAKAQAEGRIAIRKIEVETGAELLLEPGEKRSPCAFCLYFDTRDDVERFRRFLVGPATRPMREDVPRYTNCELEWTVCEVTQV